LSDFVADLQPMRQTFVVRSIEPTARNGGTLVMRKLLALLVILVLIAAILFYTGFLRADVQGGSLPSVEGGSLPKVEGGSLPSVDVDAKEVVVGTKEESVDVPVVTTEERKVDVPVVSTTDDKK
jgi:hypothetical protein